jgi:hypothetical protein
MTTPRTKGAEFSETAKSAMLEIVRSRIFGVRKSLVNLPAIKKGIACEEAGISLYNSVFLTSLKKSTERLSNGVITGEPDLIAIDKNKGVDIKVAWSLFTFPMTEEQAGKKEYEWQARGYMCLFDLPAWEIAYCAIDTPVDLIPAHEAPSSHIISPSVPLHCRLTVASYSRDLDIENAMLEKCKKALAWIDEETAEYSERRWRKIKS